MSPIVETRDSHRPISMRDMSQGDNGIDPRRWPNVLRILCFVGMLVIACYLLNGMVSKGLRMLTSDEFGAWNEEMQGRVNADVIISGSSRAANHFDPREIARVTGLTAFNIGRNGTQTDVQLGVLRAYLEHNRKPRIIIQNLDAFTFVTTRELYDPALYIPYIDDHEIYQTMRKVDVELTQGRYIPLYDYAVEDMNFTWWLGLKGLVGINPKNTIYLGFKPRDRAWSDEFDRFRAGNPKGVTFPVQPDGVRVLEDMITLCHENGIQLVLVYSPEYDGMQRMTKNREEIFAEFRELSKRYNVPFWDYSQWKYVDDTSMFYNSQHMNSRGAEMFSIDIARQLAAYMNKLGWQVGGQSASGTNVMTSTLWSMNAVRFH